MSRSASDATRFTATGPHAYSKPTAFPGTNPGKVPHPNSQPPQQPQSSPSTGKQETPREKVERLRAEARSARIKKSSSFSDRTVQAGRRWADRAHKTVVLTLITVSGVAAVVAIYSVSSLMMHTQRQRSLFIQSEMQRLSDAKNAYVAGTATPEQMTLLEKEKAAEIEKLAREKLKRQGYLYKAREWAFGGLKKDEEVAGLTSSNEAAAQKPSVLGMVNASRNGGHAALEKPASPQDHPGQQGEEEGKRASSWSKWTSWVMGR